jgi:translation initiation factor 2 beta subunit (eIF-2beta)/eIF-5
MAQPDYLICMECESPIYSFEWQEGRVVEVLCPVCGNDDPANFATEEEIDEMSNRTGGGGEEA